jgi:hypothetical protein
MCLFIIKFAPRNSKAMPTGEDYIAAPRLIILPQYKKQTSSITTYLPSIRNWQGKNENTRQQLDRHSDNLGDFEKLDCDAGAGEFDALLGIGKQNTETGHNIKKKEKEIQMREGIERFEKLKQTKLKLAEARTNFQKSMDKLNDELVIVKTEF